MNRLAKETSPYLLQHAGNPVDWYPWGDEALAKAKAEDKPILLSIGYAACHWCHVMERESFEDDATAAEMNARFVNIKVDREERPDLDSIYMTAVQAMTGHGGWPMTVFCTPEGKPFWGGTYFPPDDRHGIPSFRRVLAAIDDAWRTKRGDIEQQGDGLLDHIRRTVALRASAADLDEQILHDAARSILEQVDAEWGGFGSAPKFPQAMTIEFLLRMHLHGIDGALDVATLTLDKMARGGIFDHLAGGFARYSTDRVWLVPHFEKMLYDNGLLLRAYTHAWQVTGAPLYERTARMTAGWLLTEMCAPEGAFWSSLDADSEGEEGKFSVWDYQELIEVAGDDMPIAVAAFALAGSGNWEGKTVLWRPLPDDEVAAQAGRSPAEIEAAIERVRAALLARRAERVRPATDDKLLCAWNGLAIAGLAEYGRVFGDREAIEAAVGAADFIVRTLRDDRGRLQRSWRAGRSSGPAFLDDYACMADACLALYETTFDARWFTEARGLVDDLLALFADPEGGFFDTGSDAGELVVRPKDVFDNATPSGGSAAADVLLRMAAFTGEGRYADAAEGFLRVVAAAMRNAPLGFGNALCALDRLVTGSTELAIVGMDGREDLLAAARAGLRPNLVVAVADAQTEEPPLLKGRISLEGKATAYVCRGFVCDRPVTSASALESQLSTGKAGRRNSL